LNPTTIKTAYAAARERYAEMGVECDDALDTLSATPISLQCWQGDDVRGLETASAGDPGGGLQVTGSHPGRARNAEELRRDLAMAMALSPGCQRVNLHACYPDGVGPAADRDALEPAHFQGWIDWAKRLGIGLDFNPTFFAHSKAASGLTLTHPDPAVREFWIAHGVACRRIGQAMGRALGTPCVVNVWIPDGSKDSPADRSGPRERLRDSLDRVFAEAIDPAAARDSVEPKLFGIGSESYVAGSYDFYLAYAVARHKMLCLDMGHFHPTEGIADKLSAVLGWLDEALIHVSRGVRWDSDHVVVLSDELRTVAEEIVRGGYLPRVHLAMDYFDASINRVAAWVIGARSLTKALLMALVEPAAELRRMEADGDFTGRLALMEDLKTMPLGAVWDEFCRREDVPTGNLWMSDIRRYETDVQMKRT
jgi:L-rhamnose isomerase